METTLTGKADKIKSSIKSNAEQSKETIRAIIDSNAKHIDAALDSNRKIVDSIREKLNQQEIEDTVTINLKSSFGKSMEFAADALESIIQSYTRQMEMNVDFNTKLVDSIHESNLGSPDKMLELIQENFETSRKMVLANTREMLKFYSKHTNLAVTFSEDFGSTVHTQIESMVQLQNKGLYEFKEWASDWWSKVEKA